MNERFVVLGLARVRSPWFADVARWANSVSIPVDFLKCLSIHEVRSRLDRAPVSAVVADAGAPGVDRGLFDEARSRGVAVLVVADPHRERDWVTAGASAVLPPSFDADTLVRALTSAATPVDQVAIDAVHTIDSDDGADETSARPERRFSGGLAVVCGRAGAGVSTLAVALAEGLADRPEHRGAVILADLALDAEQAMYHDAQDRSPSILELVELHRLSRPNDDHIRELTFDVPTRGYRLLLGLPQPRAWTTLSSHGIAAALTVVRESARWVVADVTADFEGRVETGSVDVEERNALARVAAAAASVVFVAGDGSLSGVRAMAEISRRLVDHGVEPERIVAVVNRAPRSRAARHSICEALRVIGLGDSSSSDPLFLPSLRDTEARHAAVDRMSRRLSEPLAAAAERIRVRSGSSDVDASVAS